MKRITREIFMVGGPDLSHPDDACVYLITEKDKGVLVDAGCGPSVDRILSHVRKAGIARKNIRRLLLTHCHFDHTGGAEQIRDACGCLIFAHEKDAVFLKNGDPAATAAAWYNARLSPFAPDETMTGEKMDTPLGHRTITALHTPGHSPGSVVFVTESGGKKVLFGQDVHGPLDLSLHSNPDQYQASLRKIRDLSADILCEGHYGVIYGKKKVRDFISGFIRG